MTEMQVGIFAAEKMELLKMTSDNCRIYYRILLLFMMAFLSSGLLRAQDVRHITGTITARAYRWQGPA